MIASQHSAVECCLATKKEKQILSTMEIRMLRWLLNSLNGLFFGGYENSRPTQGQMETEKPYRCRLDINRNYARNEKDRDMFIITTG